MPILNAVLKAAAPVPKIGSFQTFLFIGPHPDDIELGAGATAAALAERGKTVYFLICTDGRFGTANRPDLQPEELAALREKESLASAAALGAKEVRFLRLSDGGFYDPADMKRGIASVIGELKPEVVFAPDPCVSSECHPDHINTGMAAREIAFFAPYAGIMAACGAEAADVQALAYYYTARPNRYVDTSGYLARQKEALFGCHRSQFPEGCADEKSISLYLSLRAYDYGLRSLHRTAEGFRVLGRTQMHCLPEAGE
jgi:LmbE family N-acetylglucosaminyl deacetylase